jgi:hypothetical protein
MFLEAQCCREPAAVCQPGVRSSSLFKASGPISGAPLASTSLSITSVVSSFQQGTDSISGVLPSSGSLSRSGQATPSELAQLTAGMTLLVNRIDAAVGLTPHKNGY